MTVCLFFVSSSVLLKSLFSGIIYTLFNMHKYNNCIGGDNLSFYPHFALFSTLGGMNLDHDLFQVSKLSEDQKKGLPQHKETFFPEFNWRPAFRCTPWSQIIGGGCRCRPYLKYWGKYSKLLGRIYPPSPPGFGTPANCIISTNPCCFFEYQKGGLDPQTPNSWVRHCTTLSLF